MTAVYREAVVYITRYALSQGIIEQRMLVETQGDRHFATGVQGGARQFFRGVDLHFDRTAAVAQVRRMIARRRITLERAAGALDRLERELDQPQQVVA